MMQSQPCNVSQKSKNKQQLWLVVYEYRQGTNHYIVKCDHEPCILELFATIPYLAEDFDYSKEEEFVYVIPVGEDEPYEIN